MYNINNYNNINENVFFTCSIKNSKKDYYYKILILNEEKSLGNFTSLETEELLSKEENSTLEFKNQLKGIEYRFSERQLYIIEIQKRKANSSNIDSTKRMTVMASLVSSPNSIYERKLNQMEENSEIYSIKLNINSADNLYISEFNYAQSITDFFQNNGKLKLNFLFDFSHKNVDNNYLKSINIFYNFLVGVYNLCHFYTNNDELNMYGAGVEFNYAESVFKLKIDESDEKSNHFEKLNKSFLDVLNKKFEKKELYISSFIEKCMNNIEYNNIFNVLFIFLRYIPHDIKDMINKIRKYKNNNLLFSIIIVGVGDKISDEEFLNSQISEFSNTKFIQIKDLSKNNLKEEVLCSLNHLGNNIIDLKRYINNIRKNSDNNSINEENINELSEEEEKEKKDEENSDDSGQDTKEMPNPYANYKYKGHNDKVQLQTSTNDIQNYNDNPYKSKEKRSSSSQNINNKDIKSQIKFVDSTTKTDSNSNNNEISLSNYLNQNNS